VSVIRAPETFPQHGDGDTLSQDETKANETKQLNLRQADSVVYQVHRPMSPIPEKEFSQSGISRLGLRGDSGGAQTKRRGRIWRSILQIGWMLCLCCASNVFGQSSNHPIGKNIFEAKCATCHGLDGLGGEHAPDIARRASVKGLSDEALLNVIHEGLPEDGMPGFPSITGEASEALIAYLRKLQGGDAGTSAAGDAARGHDLFFGKGGCSGCHEVKGGEKFLAGALGGFGRDHTSGEIRDAIVRPTGAARETVTAVARDGRNFSGRIRNEDNASMQLQDERGQIYLLMKSDLVSIQRTAGTAMPADYGQRLSGSEIDDLTSYILREARSEAELARPAEK
jgi:cytochrome c oxidase cbb3-type subunit 3